MDQLTREWSTFFERCLQHRMQANVFDELALQLHSRSPLPGSKLAGLLLKPREPAAASIDPRVIVYCERLLALKKISAPDVLSATFQYSKDRLPRVEEGQSVSKDDPSKWLNPAELEEVIFDRLHRMFATGERPITDNERIATVSIVTRWMSAMVTSHTSDSMIQAMVEGVQQHPQQSSINVREGLGMLIVNLIENNKTLQLLDKDHAKGRSIICQLFSVYRIRISY
jgi:mediator of RNA polymerase II transcription subunit 5